MKKSIFFLIIVDLILFFIMIQLFLKIKSQDLSKREIKNISFGSLHIENKHFKDINNNFVILEGFSTMKFAREPYFHNKQEFLNLLDLLNNLKTNTNFNSLLVYINEETIKDSNYLNYLDYLVDYCYRNNIYMIFSLTQKDDSSNLKVLLEKAPLFINKLIKKYKKYTHILYTLWAEPNFSDYKEWENYYLKSLKIIRKENSKELIGISGNYYGRKFPTKSLIYEQKNIYLVFHDYPADNNINLNSMKIEKFLWDQFYKKYPIVIEEFGGVWEDGFNSIEDLNYIKKVLLDAKNKNLSFFAYVLDSDNQLSLFKDFNYFYPTIRGELFLQFFK